jgi:hypothetical protein
MPREILREKLYNLIKNIDDESMLVEISNYLDNIVKHEDKINFEANDLDEFINQNTDALRNRMK